MTGGDENRLWSRFHEVDGCWVWQGATQAPGYGRISWGGVYWYTHRLAWRLVHGPIPEGMFVCHTCDNPPCIRPAHLFLGSPKDNIADASGKGRMHPGESHGMARLTVPQVHAIRARLADGHRPVDIAPDFGIHPNTVHNIKHGRAWRHV